MSNAIYAALGRQQGLMQEMQVVSNNLANSATTGYKTDRAIFAEFLVSTGTESPSLSMGGLAAHSFELSQSALEFTGGQLDLAVQGEGFFLIQTGQGIRLTRAGHFLISPNSTLVDPAGNTVLNRGGGPITIPPEASTISIAGDGSISADGAVIDQVGLVIPDGDMLRDSNTRFSAPGGYGQATEATVVQGALEQSNVSPVLEISRMIEVQRAYEAGQSLREKEDQRLSQLIGAVRER